MQRHRRAGVRNGTNYKTVWVGMKSTIDETALSKESKNYAENCPSLKKISLKSSNCVYVCAI